MLVERLNLVRKVQEVNDEYGLNGTMLCRWKREYKAKSRDFLLFYSCINGFLDDFCMRVFVIS
jgi:hypothetical protein